MIIKKDLQPNNLLMGVDDESIFSDYEKEELEHPVPRKIIIGDDRIIYLSRPLSLTFGPPVLCDLGEARLGDEEHDDDIMPDVYRAPEVILGMKWSYQVDIWSVAMVVRKAPPLYLLLSVRKPTIHRSICSLCTHNAELI